MCESTGTKTMECVNLLGLKLWNVNCDTFFTHKDKGPLNFQEALFKYFLAGIPDKPPITGHMCGYPISILDWCCVVHSVLTAHTGWSEKLMALLRNLIL